MIVPVLRTAGVRQARHDGREPPRPRPRGRRALGAAAGARRRCCCRRSTTSIRSSCASASRVLRVVAKRAQSWRWDEVALRGAVSPAAPLRGPGTASPTTSRACCASRGRAAARSSPGDIEAVSELALLLEQRSRLRAGRPARAAPRQPHVVDGRVRGGGRRAPRRVHRRASQPLRPPAGGRRRALRSGRRPAAPHRPQRRADLRRRRRRPRRRRRRNASSRRATGTIPRDRRSDAAGGDVCYASSHGAPAAASRAPRRRGARRTGVAWSRARPRGVAGVLPAAASAQAAPELRLSVAVGPTLPLGRAAERWAQRMREGAGGDRREAPSRREPRADATRRARFPRSGTAAPTSPSGSSLQWSLQVPGTRRVLAAVDRPDDAQLAALVGDAAVRELLRRAHSRRRASQLVAIAPLGYREVANSRAPDPRTRGLAGLRLRATASPLLQDILRALGAQPQSMPFAQAQDGVRGRGSSTARRGRRRRWPRRASWRLGQRHVTDLGGIAEAMVFAVRAARVERLDAAHSATTRGAPPRWRSRTRRRSPRSRAALRELGGAGGRRAAPDAGGQEAFRARHARGLTNAWRANVGDGRGRSGRARACRPHAGRRPPPAAAGTPK